MKEIALPQGTIRYRELGDGPPILFVHGLLVDGELWRPVAEALAPTHRCLVPDWPLGSHTTPMRADADLSPRGMAALVAAFAEALDLTDVTLVGNDSGGAVSQLVAARHRERIGRLVLTDCDALEVFPPAGFGYVKWLPRVPGLMWCVARALLALPALRRAPSAYGALTRRRLSDELLRAWVEPAARDRRIRRDTAKFLRGISNRLTLAAAEELCDFDRPVLFLWSRIDRFFPLELAERLAALLPDARVEPVDEGSVYLALDRPDAVAEGIARFIGETRGRAPSPSRARATSPARRPGS